MYVHFILIFITTIIVRAENDPVNERIEEENKNFDDTERRFMDSLNEQEWHVAHLKAADFENTRRSGCKEDSIAEKKRKYRKSLKNDPGRITFVSSQALPFDENDLEEYKCIPEDNAEGVKQTESTTEAVKVTEPERMHQTDKTIDKPEMTTEIHKAENPAANIDNTNTRSSKDLNTTILKEADEEQRKETATINPSKLKEGVRKSGDYVFTSAEYEDDVVDFSATVCPNDVEVIVLEQDIIRNYDVECELALEWRSLDLD